MTAALEGGEWSAARPGRNLPPVLIVKEAGRAPEPVWTGGKSRPHRDSIPYRPARSQSLYRLSYRPTRCNVVKTDRDRLCTYNVTLMRCRVTVAALEKYYIFWVCVCNLRYPACNERALQYIAWLYGTIFGGG